MMPSSLPSLPLHLGPFWYATISVLVQAPVPSWPSGNMDHSLTCVLLALCTALHNHIIASELFVYLFCLLDYGLSRKESLTIC